MTVQQAYTQWATTYDTDRNRTRDLDALVTRQILAGRQRRSILELGCGTGKNTAFLAEIGDGILALDFSEGMLEKAREKVQASRVTFAVADLTHRWPTDDGAADLVVCNLVLEHIENLAFVFSEAARSLEDNGHLFLCELHPFRQYQGTVANFQRDEETTAIPAFVHNVSDYLAAASINDFTLEQLNEWWHEEDSSLPPRLVSFLFRYQG